MDYSKEGGVCLQKTDSIAAFCGLVWFAFIIDACFTWFFFWTVRYVVSSLFIFYATLVLRQYHGLTYSKKRFAFFISIFTLAVFVFFIKFQPLTAFFRYVPFLCVIFWRDSALQKMYKYIRNFILFYAILSIFVEVLVISGVWASLPYITFPPIDNVQEELGYTNYYFGLYSIQATDTSLAFYRACGPVREGGHFSLFLGFVYFADKAIYNKRSIWIILCGLLTLSPNFPLMFIISESYSVFSQKEILKPIMMVVMFVLFALLAFLFAPENVQDEVIRVIIERSLERNVNNMEDEGIMALINGRAGTYGLQDFDSFLKKGALIRLFGMEELPEGNVMSDPRYLIMLYGFIGTLIIFLCIITFSLKSEFNLFGISLSLLGFLIFIHRAWMYEQLYWEAMMFLIINEKKIQDSNKNKILSIN